MKLPALITPTDLEEMPADIRFRFLMTAPIESLFSLVVAIAVVHGVDLDLSSAEERCGD